MTPSYLPSQPIPPDDCFILASRLGEALDHVRSWGIRVNRRSRLSIAIDLLSQIGTTRVYPSGNRDLVRAANAMRAAMDFGVIVNALEASRTEALAEAIKRSLGGTLDDVGPTAAHRAQAELRLGATLAAGGLRPRVPRQSHKKAPDYVVELRGLEVGVEVKRPAKSSAALDRLDDAARQLTEFGSAYHMIVLDLADCLSSPPVIVPSLGALTVVEDDFRTAFHRSCNAASDHMTAMHRRHLFGRTIVFAATSTSFVWLRGERITPIGLMLAYPEVFHWACSGLLVEFGRDLRNRLRAGWEFYGMRLAETNSA